MQGTVHLTCFGRNFDMIASSQRVHISRIIGKTILYLSWSFLINLFSLKVLEIKIWLDINWPAKILVNCKTDICVFFCYCWTYKLHVSITENATSVVQTPKKGLLLTIFSNLSRNWHLMLWVSNILQLVK